MPTREITRDEWTTYFDDFSKNHQGEQATLRQIGDEIGDQVQAEMREFVGISADDKGSDAGSIMVMLGAETSDNMETLIAKPTAVFVREGDSHGHTADIEIRQKDGQSLIVELQRPAQLTETEWQSK